MTLPHEIEIARHNLTRHPWITVLMTLGLAVAILLMVYIPSTMTSFYESGIARSMGQESPRITTSLLDEISMVKRITTLINVIVAITTVIVMSQVFSASAPNTRKELASLQTAGASSASLKIIFLLEAAIVWVAGTALGLAAVLGVMAYEQSHPLVMSAQAYGITSYATSPRLKTCVAATVLGAAAMAASALWGGRKTVKQNPSAVIFAK